MATPCSRAELSDGWTLMKLGSKPEDVVPVKRVPSDVYTDLLRAGRIPDPFQDLNELAVRHIADEDWVYILNFQESGQQDQTRHDLPIVDDFIMLSADALMGPPIRTDIVFKGLDTFATVCLNGKKILESDNMFMSYRIDVTQQIEESNRLEIIFKSAKRRGENILARFGPLHRFIARQTEQSRIPVRKAQYHWGWDWGPILTGTSGIWRPVWLERYVARIDDLWMYYDLSGAEFSTCRGDLYCSVAGMKEGDEVAFVLKSVGETVFERTNVAGPVRDDYIVVNDGFARDGIKLWWPRGYGDQHLYEYTAILKRNGEILDTKTTEIGLRKVELVQQDDQFGKSFYFRINGIDVFAGGSCWIPASSHLSQISAEKYQRWVKALADGNQAMVRVWGGGIYEDDAFYTACDKTGVLVWQDFCFACGNYPGFKWFLDALGEEARQNVRRLRCHPSLVIWAGSNEDYQVQERYKLDYNYDDKDWRNWLKSNFPARFIYEHLLPKIVREEHPNAVYHPSSPWGDGKPTTDPTVGDIHQCNIWHGTMEKYQSAQTMGGRFVSEFGMEAYPHAETITSMLSDPEERRPGSMMMDFHNKAIGHERRLVGYMAENYGMTSELNAFIHISQILQADTVGYAYKVWRRQWGRPNNRQCGGVLVWQLNDCWPAISWSVIDHYLVRKPAFYTIKRALEPLTISISRRFHDWTKTYMDDMLEIGHVDPTVDFSGEVKFEVWVSNIRPESHHGKVYICCVSIPSGQTVLEQVLSANIFPNGNTEVMESKPMRNREPFVIYAALVIDGRMISHDTAWPQPIKYLTFKDRGLKFREVECPAEGYKRVLISAERPVKGLVFEEKRSLWLSSNNFDIIPRNDYVMDVSGIQSSWDELPYTYIGAPNASMTMEMAE